MYVIHFTGELFIRDSVDYYVISTLPAGEQGFEPRSATLKAAVLPLNYSSSNSRCPEAWISAGELVLYSVKLGLI